MKVKGMDKLPENVGGGLLIQNSQDHKYGKLLDDDYEPLVGDDQGLDYLG